MIMQQGKFHCCKLWQRYLAVPQRLALSSYCIEILWGNGCQSRKIFPNAFTLGEISPHQQSMSEGMSITSQITSGKKPVCYPQGGRKLDPWITHCMEGSMSEANLDFIFIFIFRSSNFYGVKPLKFGSFTVKQLIWLLTCDFNENHLKT